MIETATINRSQEHKNIGDLKMPKRLSFSPATSRFAFHENDGGRSKSGFKGTTGLGDCVTRAIAISNDLDYKEVYKELHARGKEHYATWIEEKESSYRIKFDRRSIAYYRRKASPRNGVNFNIWDPMIRSLGWEKTTFKTWNEIPLTGTFIVHITRHLFVIKDGIIEDSWNPALYHTDADIVNVYAKADDSFVDKVNNIASIYGLRATKLNCGGFGYCKGRKAHWNDNTFELIHRKGEWTLRLRKVGNDVEKNFANSPDSKVRVTKGIMNITTKNLRALTAHLEENGFEAE